MYEEDFGPLNDTFVKLWCGGTLVFSREGNVLHYAMKKMDDRHRLEERL